VLVIPTGDLVVDEGAELVDAVLRSDVEVDVLGAQLH
jgi:hypothetical protein